MCLVTSSPFKNLIFIWPTKLHITATKNDVWLEGIPKSSLQEFSGLGSYINFFICLETISPINGPSPNIWKCFERNKNNIRYENVHIWKVT